MRQETNNEMDLLLRRLGRRQDASPSTDHLDADELSSYAENVLPPAARARYTEHVAECARCRELVVQLSSSAGVVIAQETAKLSEPSVLRKFLASLFSPMVLRYAVPALGLVVVAAIGLIVLRQQSRSESPLAQVTEQERAQAPVPASQPQQSSSPAASFDSPESPAANKAVSQNNSGSQPVQAPPPNAPPTVGAITTEVQPEATPKKVEQQEVEAKEAPPAPKPAAADELKKLDTEARKQKAENRALAANEPPAEKAGEESKREDRRAEVAATPASRLRSKSATVGMAEAQGAGARAGQRDDAGEKDKDDKDTQTVAGRRFRKQGNVWVDTAYNSSRSVISLTRGSDQYRSLVADEPEIKRIADQLDGEIIVVWKGSAYRIR